MTDAAENPRNDKAPRDLKVYGMYHGYPIIDVRLEWRGMNGGLTAAAAIEGPHIITAPNEFAFVAAKGQKISEDHDFVRNDVGDIVGVALIQVYRHVGVAFTDEEAAGKSINETMERVAQAEADEQNAFKLNFGGRRKKEAEGETPTEAPEGTVPIRR